MDIKNRDVMFKCLALFELWNGELNFMRMVILLYLYVYTKKLRRSENAKDSRALTVSTRQANLNRILHEGNRSSQGDLRMVEKFPDCGIEKRHMQNKHKRLKEKYQTTFDMLNYSGFSWNDSKQSVEVDSKQVLDECMKKHPNKHYTPGIDEIEGDAPTSPADPSDPPGPSGTPATTASVHIIGSVDSSSNTAGNQQKKRKRKMRDIELFKSLIASFDRAIDYSRENAKIIADAIAKAQIPKLGEELENLGFSTAEVVRIARIFSKNTHAGNLFWSLTADQKQAYVKSFLDDEV